MKIEVLQVEDVKFKPYRYWSNWIDVFCYQYVGPYLVQMKVSRCNGKKFRTIRMVSFFNSVTVSIPKDLTGPEQIKGDK